MDEAALIVAIVAVVLSVVVAGFGMLLQWLMFRASTDQLTNIGKENAALVTSIAMSLGTIQKTTTITQDTVSRQLEQVFVRLLDKAFAGGERVAEEAEPAEVPQVPVEEPVKQWEVRRTTSEARTFSAVRLMLTYLDGEDEGKSHNEIRDHLASAYEDDAVGSLSAALDFFMALGTLNALRAVELKGDNLALTETGKLAARLLERLDTGGTPATT